MIFLKGFTDGLTLVRRLPFDSVTDVPMGCRCCAESNPNRSQRHSALETVRVGTFLQSPRNSYTRDLSALDREMPPIVQTECDE